MFGLVLKSLLFLALCIELSGGIALAQTYSAIGYGSNYVCGYTLAGANQLFRAGGNGSEIISAKRAIASVNNDISKLQVRVQKLSKISFSLRDKKLSFAEIRTFNRIAKASSSKGGTLPVAHSKRVKAVRRALSAIKALIKNKKREIVAIASCGRGRAGSAPSSNTLTYEQIKLKGLNGFYVATVMYLPKQSASSFWYCIRGPWQTEGEPRLFSDNPCVGGWPSVRSSDCSQLTPSSMFTSIYASRLFLGPDWDTNNPYVNAAVKELEGFYSGNIVGRPRTSTKDDCKIIP